MKKLNLEQMELVEGGGTSNYCTTLRYWINHDGEGYQGDFLYLLKTYYTNCA